MKTEKIRNMTICAVMAALMCSLSPICIQIGPVPVTLISMLIYLTVYILGVKKACISFLIYLMLGIAGLPVFSGFTAGIGKLAGPTGGYLAGFFLTIIIEGIIIEKTKRKNVPAFLAMIIGTAADYAVGTCWFMLVAHCDFLYAFCVCVLWFIPIDMLKAAAALRIGRLVYKRMKNARVI